MKQQFNMPIFRGERVDNGECIIGLPSFENNKGYHGGYREFVAIITTNEYGVQSTYEIDPCTLSIHFPNMIAKDSKRFLPNGEKDLRIFASLSEDGRGGDILEDSGENYQAIFKNSCFVVCNDEVNKLCFESVVIKGVKK